MYRLGLGADVCPKSTEFPLGLQSALLLQRVFFAKYEHTVYLCLIAFLCLPKTVPKDPKVQSPFEPCLEELRIPSKDPKIAAP